MRHFRALNKSITNREHQFLVQNLRKPFLSRRHSAILIRWPTVFTGFVTHGGARSLLIRLRLFSLDDSRKKSGFYFIFSYDRDSLPVLEEPRAACACLASKVGETTREGNTRCTVRYGDQCSVGNVAIPPYVGPYQSFSLRKKKKIKKKLRFFYFIFIQIETNQREGKVANIFLISRVPP